MMVSANMDVSSVQTKSSDFSIERILSEDRRSETPNWICCTRYQPPRIPRPASGGRARRSGRHARVPFTAAQAQALEAAYARAPYLAPPALRALAAALQLRDDRIKIWFQNRRARERREKSVPTPPNSVPLPPTAVSLPGIMPNVSWVQNIPYTSINNTRIVLEPSAEPQDLTSSKNHYLHSSFSDPSDENDSRDGAETPLDVESVD